MTSNEGLAKKLIIITVIQGFYVGPLHHEITLPMAREAQWARACGLQKNTISSCLPESSESLRLSAGIVNIKKSGTSVGRPQRRF